MSKVTDPGPRCAACGQPLAANVPFYRVEQVRRGPRGGETDLGVWGEVHPECFAKTVGGPRAVLQTLKKIAAANAKQPAHAPAPVPA